MKPTRILATASLVISSFALITAASISVGDETGVVRMGSGQAAPAPAADMSVPPVPNSTGVATLNQPGQGIYPQPSPYAPYFERSMGATEAVPNVFYTPVQPFGPIIDLDTNLGSGLGYEKGYQRFSARLPYHVLPNTTVLMSDLQASVTFDGSPIASAGVIYRNYDQAYDRVFGWNAYVDYDEGYGYGDWTRVTAGFESLGKYIDYRVNGYFMVGDDSAVISSTLLPTLGMSGNNVFKLRDQMRENAYSGVNGEMGGPLPYLGRYGVNAYGGAYYLTNDYGSDTVGAQFRGEVLVTQNLTVNTYVTTDDTFDENVWVGMTYSFPNYKAQRTLRPRNTRERLQDPVVRQNRIQTHIDQVIVPEALVNHNSGALWNLVHVDPNATLPGNGTFENPYNALQLASNANNAGVDIIRVQPRDDDSGTNLTVNGGLTLFDDQVLLSSLKPFALDPICVIQADPATTSGLGPLISNPIMAAGGSVVHLANNNQVIGMRIDAANAAGTVFGNGVSNALPITDVNISCNTFTNYVFGANLQDVTGRVIVDENVFDGLLGVSQNGLDLTIAANSTAEVLVRNNEANDNSGVGLSIVAEANSTLNADDPNGTVPTGIIDNVTNDNGTGMLVEARTGAEINAVIEGNTAEGNTFDGLQMVADGGTFNLASLANNTYSSNLGNGTFIHYLNGGLFRAVSEDADGDGVLDPGEDLNGNGLLDQGIVSNNMNDNLIAGLCIFGENASVGEFDIGGPTASLGNTFNGNLEGGVLVDLRDTATAQVDALFNTITGGNANPALTIVLDFIDPGQNAEVDINGNTVNTFDVTAYGFNQSQYDTVTNAVMATLRDYYRNLPTAGEDVRSPIPDGQELNIDFVIGDTGVAPSNGATEYYVMTIGDSPTAPFGLAGQAGDIGNIRNALGQGPGQGLIGTPQAVGDSSMGVYTNNIVGLSPFLNPPNALNGAPNEGIYVDPSNSAPYAVTALTSGNLTFTRRALGYIAAHELGHTLSLRHILANGAVTPTGQVPIMGTPAFDVPIQTLVEPVEFAYSGTNPGELPGEAPFVQNDFAQLVSAIGTRAVAGETKNGIRVNATDDARLLESTINNNTITGASENGIAVLMNDSAVAEDLTIQGNQITNGGGNGVHLVADGPGAEIHADNTIGGDGINVYAGTSYNQGNLITNNAGDGFRALAANGGTINGNLISNTITDNGGNGAALLIDNGGFIDFGTVASNRVIRGNTITGNGGAGLLLNQLTAPDTEAQLDATVLGNTISNNVGGGIISRLNGANNLPPALPLIQNNNRLNLVVGGPTAAEANTINGNGDAGIAVHVAGNGLANVDLENVTVTGTVDGADPDLNGSGIDLRRSDSSLLTATLDKVTSTGNEGDGLHVETQGNDRLDPNQPNSGTANTITITDSNFSSNGQNGAAYFIRGDSTTISDISNSTFQRNGQDGVTVQTSENASFGDPTVGLPPGRRSVWDGNVFEENGRDGVNVVAIEESRALIEITSNAVPAASSAHAAASRLGVTSISNNGRDGVHIETTGGRSDILIHSGSATTVISGNGTVAGGNGIRWDASGDSDAIVRVNSTIIEGNIAGATEAAGDPNANGDVDVADGDGIQANFSQDSTSTLIVGGVNAGNFIRNNEDDGIAITATGSNLTGNPRPVITIVDNVIGGTIDGLPAGNGGDGISMNVFGGTATGIPTASVDFTLPILSFNGGVTESGAIPNLTIRNNLISNNAQRGVNLLLTGASGFRDRENGNSLFDPVQITLEDNTIISNGTEGVFMRADSNMNQSRFVYLANFPDPPIANNDNQNFSPFRAEFFALNAGSVNGNTAYLAPYMNLRTVQNTMLTMTNNTIQNNGRGTVTGEGVRIEVGTGSYVAADVQGNVFGGNLEEDFVTSSFLSAGNTFNSNDTNGDLTFDYIYLDDTAQFDLRFQNNSGNQVAPSELGAIYTNLDTLKEQFFGTIGVQQRQTSLFQVDNGPNLNNPNNSFINFGITQDIQQSFTNGGYNLRGAADPLFPNIGFAPFLP